MGGAQESGSSWMEDEASSMDEKQKTFEEGSVDFEEKMLKHEIVAKSSMEQAFQWEESSNCSQDGCSSGGGGNKERLVIKFRRITGTYYMVDEIPESPDPNLKYFNYKSQRYSFPTYHVSLADVGGLVTPTKRGGGGGGGSAASSPKVFRCKTCRKVFSKMSTLKVHRKTHAAFAPAGTFTPGEFAKRFSSERVSKEPYKPAAHLRLLDRLPQHPRQYAGYLDLPGPLPFIKPGQPLRIRDEAFCVGDMIGEGGFAKVFAATWETGPAEEREAVLKVQMPPNDWEWYIISEVHARFDSLSHPLKDDTATVWKKGFMSAPRCFTYSNGAILVSQQQKMGTLLDLVNLTKNADRSIVEPIAIYMTAELLGLLELLHSMQIVHADIKPDNFLVRHTPSTQSSPSLQVIDFGKAIDLRLEGEEGEEKPPQQQEQEEEEKKVEKEGAAGGNTEQKGRTGKYHLDYFGIAGAAYCLLFGKYIEVGTVRNRWVVKGSFKRWWQVKLWEQFFDDMLNPRAEDRGADGLPSLYQWRLRFLELFQIEELREGLAKAREIIEMKFLEKWRRSL